MRACRYTGLPAEQRNVQIDIYIATLPSYYPMKKTDKRDGFTTVDKHVLKLLAQGQKDWESAMRIEFAEVAVDKTYLDQVIGEKTPETAPAVEEECAVCSGQLKEGDKCSPGECPIPMRCSRHQSKCWYGGRGKRGKRGKHGKHGKHGNKCSPGTCESPLVCKRVGDHKGTCRYAGK